MNIQEYESAHFQRKDLVGFIDFGIDSEVFRFGDKAVKVYKDHVPLELAQRYQDITNRSAEYVRDNPFNGKMKVDGVDMPFEVSINPILDITSDIDGTVIGVSNYIPGPHMYILEGLKYLAIKDRILLDITENVPDKEEKDFLFGLVKSIYVNKTYVKPVLDRSDDFLLLDRFSSFLNSSLGVHGVNIWPENVKFRFNPNSQQVNLIVTDLCLILNGLRRNT